MLKYLPIAAVACGLFSLGNQASAFDLKSWVRGDPKEKVEVTITYDEGCPREEPLRFRISNKSSETIRQTMFSVVGRWPGRSSAPVSTWRPYSDDHILDPGYYVSYCMSPLYMAGAHDFKEERRVEVGSLGVHKIHKTVYSYPGMKGLEWEATVEEVYTK